MRGDDYPLPRNYNQEGTPFNQDDRFDLHMTSGDNIAKYKDFADEQRRYVDEVLDTAAATIEATENAELKLVPEVPSEAATLLAELHKVRQERLAA